MNGRIWRGRSCYRFDGYHASRSTALFIIQCCCFWILGNSFVPVMAAGRADRITGAQAVERMRQVLGDPQTFEDDMRNSTEDFIKDHFGSMAIATAFAIAIRMKT
jgi:hypothetical protein